MKKVSIGTAVALAAMAAAVTVSLTYLYAMERFNSKVADVNERQAMYAKLNEIDQKVRQDAVGTLDETALKDGICEGYVAGLGDANAQYLSAERYRILQQGSAEENIGVGVRTIQDEDGNMEVVEVLPGSSAEEAGIRNGDVIVAVDGSEVIRITYGEALTRLSGAAGSEITLRVLRTGEQEVERDGKTVTEEVTEPLEFTLERRAYEDSSIDWDIINGNVGCITVGSFTEETAQEVEEAVSALQEQGVCGIVLDLRGNTSGSVAHMVEAFQQFLPAGNVAQYVNSSEETVVEFTAGSQRLALPLAMVADDTTYGAAEVMAAAMRDGKAAVLVGTTTAGAASRQETLPLSDGSAVILTVGYYVDAQGNSLYGQGVAPDREVELSILQKQVLLRGMLDPREDPQMQTAVTALIEQGAQVQQVPGTEEQETASQTSGSDSAEE